MRAYIVTTPIGCFGVEENNKIISFRLFPKDPEKIAEKLKVLQEKILEEEREVEEELKKKGFKQIFFSVARKGVKSIPGSEAEKFIKSNLRKIAVEKGFVKDEIEFNQLLVQVNVQLAKKRIKESIKKDRIVVQVNGAIEEIDKTINILVERLREWYGLHFPELNKTVKSHEKFAKIVKNFGKREKIKDPELKKIAESSMGTDFEDEDIRAVKLLAQQILELYALREKLQKYLEKLLKKVAPNLAEIAGPMLAAKLIAKAGSLLKLAKMPSSTIQLLGAEKSLFRYLHGKGKPPKYGLIFTHPLIQKAPKKHRGKIARAIASKLSMAVKIDYYSREYKGDKLKKDLEEKVKRILGS
ncbi:MAG TPA: C/D box methylation guide ribonucleoprotein complex aNOP56 subunit [Candidatus Aenigmarchaeota archaeon]|nr:C/D box methylation guide ribonucleoprotein complex aNOP56 subunit [Candidatus Aenigmarchaeota archaeon]